MRILHTLSIVSPARNEADNVPSLHAAIEAVLAPLMLDWELIVVDDGSTDGTFEQLRALHDRDPRVKALRLSRNFGHEAATTAGLEHATGEAVILIDADFQDPPELLPEMIALWRAGNDIVTARRLSREGESFFKRATSSLYSRMIFSMAGWDIPKDTGDFGLYGREVVKAFCQCRERNRLVRALMAWPGFQRTEITFNRPKRLGGETKYGVFRLIALGLNSLLSFSIVPLRMLWSFGLGLMAVSVAGFAGLALWNGISMALCLLASLWFIAGMQCVFLGLVGEYVGKIYVEVQQKPNYIVWDRLGLEP